MCRSPLHGQIHAGDLLAPRRIFSASAPTSHCSRLAHICSISTGSGQLPASVNPLGRASEVWKSPFSSSAGALICIPQDCRSTQPSASTPFAQLTSQRAGSFTAPSPPATVFLSCHNQHSSPRAVSSTQEQFPPFTFSTLVICLAFPAKQARLVMRALFDQ